MFAVTSREGHVRVEWRGADSHMARECLFELLRRWQQVCLDVDRRPYRGSEGPGDDLRYAALDPEIVLSMALLYLYFYLRECATRSSRRASTARSSLYTPIGVN